MVALKVEIGSTTIEFDKEEILDCEIKNNCDIQIAERQEGITLDYVSLSNQTFILKIKENYSTTKAKILQIIETTEEIKLYYEYRYNPTSYAMVIPYQKDTLYTKSYVYGNVEAEVINTLNLIQSS